MDDLPPCDLAAEQQLLGLLMADNRQIRGVRHWLSWTYFADPVHATIYTAILARFRRGEPATPELMGHDFTDRNSLIEVGGPVYLAQLVSALEDKDADAAVLARRILVSWVLRQDELVDELRA